MKSLYESTNLGGIEVRNRFVRSATHEGDNRDSIINVYSELSKGQVGLIMTGAVEVTEQKVFHNSLSAVDKAHDSLLKDIVNTVHGNDGKVMAQLLFGGPVVFWDIDYEPIAPSAVMDRFSKILPKAMTEADISMVISNFTDAAQKCKKLGFDGVQIHGAAGFLMNKFISPYYNRRTDRYGGSIENRARILIEIRKSIASVCGKDYPVFIKLTIDEYMDDDVKGLEFEEGKEIAKLLSKSGYDAIEVAGGIVGEMNGSRRKSINFDGQDGYFKDQTIALSKEVDISLIAVGGIRTEEVAMELINYEHIEAVSFSRPLICDPDLPMKWQLGEKTRCVSCNKCMTPEGIVCVLNR